jgi:hypothetical protein
MLYPSIPSIGRGVLPYARNANTNGIPVLNALSPVVVIAIAIGIGIAGVWQYAPTYCDIAMSICSYPVRSSFSCQPVSVA